MIKSIVMSYEWPPSEISAMYVDEVDYMGIEYWYEIIKKKATPG